MPRWTEEQQSVISHRDGNLLVSAAAGSGKTAVLVEHVIDRILDKDNPISLSSLVLMTFTEAAAAEMKERIKLRLTEVYSETKDSFLQREITLLSTAKISTIDSFCKKLIQENYSSLGIEPNFRIGEENELSLLQEDIIEELLEEEYSKSEERFLSFVDQFSSGKQDKGIQEIILKLYRLATSNPFPEEYLKNLEKDSEVNWKGYLLHRIRASILELKKILRDGLLLCDEEGGPMEYKERLEDEYETLLALSEIKNEEEQGEVLHLLLKKIQAIEFGRLKNSKAERKDEVKAKRDLVKAVIQNWQKNYSILPEDIEDKMETEGRKRLQEAIRLSLLFLERYQEEKRERNILDFSDLEHFALKLLYEEQEGEKVYSAIANELAGELSEILVDEYQDSNMVQEYIVKALSKERFSTGNVFQVGDVKQSIYRFRLARPELFLVKYYDENYPKIFLQKNFRSFKGVIDVVNACFYKIMKKDLGGIEYDRESSLFLGREEKEGVDDQAELLLTETEDSEESALKLECRMIAQKIKELHHQGIEYKDMVILLRSPKKSAKDMVEVFTEEGIPSYAESAGGYYSQPEVETLLSMLSVIDNPKQDIALAAVLRSPMYSFTDEELSFLTIKYGSLVSAFACFSEEKKNSSMEVGRNSSSEGEEKGSESAHNPKESGVGKNKADYPSELDGKWEHFCRSLERYRILSRNLRIHELLYMLYEESSYYLYVQSLPMGEKRKANLDRLIDDAKKFEKGSYSGLFHFIRYIEKARKKDYDEGEASVYSENDNLLRIMSIHHSKGLQFKVVFLSLLQKSFNKMDSRETILLDEQLGMASDYIDLEERIKYPSLHRTAIKEKINEENLGEELRLLYVAMTRAEEKLIMTASCSSFSKLEKKFAAKQDLSIEDLRGANSYLDFLMLAFSKVIFQGLEHSPLKLSLLTQETIKDEAEKEKEEAIDVEKALYQFLRSPKEKTIEEECWDKDFHYVYPHEESTHLYPKYAVSLLKEEAMEKLKEEMRSLEKKEQTEVIQIQELPNEDTEFHSYSEKKEKSRGARIGDSFHHALALFDYNKGLEQLPDILEEEELELIHRGKLEKYLASPLGIKMKEAFREKRLFREKHFMQALPYKELFQKGEEREEVLLQGIIDAFIVEEDGIILVDYKTDRVGNAAELVERYRKQMELYSAALEAIIGIKVKRRVLYSFALGKEVEL